MVTNWKVGHTCPECRADISLSVPTDEPGKALRALTVTVTLGCEACRTWVDGRLRELLAIDRRYPRTPGPVGVKEEADHAGAR